MSNSNAGAILSQGQFANDLMVKVTQALAGLPNDAKLTFTTPNKDNLYEI